MCGHSERPPRTAAIILLHVAQTVWLFLQGGQLLHLLYLCLERNSEKLSVRSVYVAKACSTARLILVPTGSGKLMFASMVVK
jgi:hypothetical protein